MTVGVWNVIISVCVAVGDAEHQVGWPLKTGPLITRNTRGEPGGCLSAEARSVSDERRREVENDRRLHRA